MCVGGLSVCVVGVLGVVLSVTPTHHHHNQLFFQK